MRIRTQFILTVLLFGLILIVLAASAIIANQQIEKIVQQEDLATHIAQGASELSYLANDYLIYRESQQLRRLQSRFASFANQVASLNVGRPEQQALARNIRVNQERMKEVLGSVTSVLGGPPQQQSGDLDMAFLQISWSRMAVQSQGLVSDASHLSRLLHRQRDGLIKARTLFIYLMVGLFGLLLLAGYMVIYRRILRSVAILQAGTAVIGSGDLDFTIKEKKNDEIGDLSHAFNQMTANLKTVTASKADLEKEIVERERLETELQASQKFLEIANRHSDLNALLKEFLSELEKFTGCQAVGIRILDGDGNIPYMAYLGFNRQFYETESPLSIKADQCMCVNVVKGTTDPGMPFYTAGGSFYMNGTTRFLATVSEEDKGQTRNVCNQMGYESVALIPIRVENRIVGLIHLADPKENMVPLSLVKVLERAASALGVGIQRASAEEELREQREWLRVTLSSIGDAVIASNEKGRINFLNPVAAALTGWQTEEAMDQPVQSVFRIMNEKTRTPAEDLVARVLDEKRAVSLANDTALVTRDGREVPIEDSAAPILDRVGNLIGAVLVFHDVTEKRRTQQALRESHERAVWLARFPDENPNPVLRVSVNGSVLYCNPASVKLSGWRCKVGEVLQNDLFSLVGRAMAEGREFQQDVQFGESVYLVWITPFPEESYANVYGRDITERKQMEEELRRSRVGLELRVQERTEELTTMNERLKRQIEECQRMDLELRKSESHLRYLSSELLSAQEKERRRVAHEIHDSIGASLAATKFKVEATVVRIGDSHPQACEALKDIIPILQGTIDEARRIQMALRPSILDDLGLLATINWFCRQYESTHSAIRVKQEIEIEEHDISDVLKTVIFRVLQEAMNNIAKHSKANQVIVALRKTGRAIQLVVLDNGHGFVVEEVLSRKSPGRGLGLDSMKERTELSGGSFTIKSAGSGTGIQASWPL